MSSLSELRIRLSPLKSTLPNRAGGILAVDRGGFLIERIILGWDSPESPFQGWILTFASHLKFLELPCSGKQAKDLLHMADEICAHYISTRACRSSSSFRNWFVTPSTRPWNSHQPGKLGKLRYGESRADDLQVASTALTLYMYASHIVSMLLRNASHVRTLQITDWTWRT